MLLLLFICITVGTLTQAMADAGTHSTSRPVVRGGIEIVEAGCLFCADAVSHYVHVSYAQPCAVTVMLRQIYYSGLL